MPPAKKSKLQTAAAPIRKHAILTSAAMRLVGELPKTLTNADTAAIEKAITAA
jgi:protein required for attachment to host cells